MSGSTAQPFQKGDNLNQYFLLSNKPLAAGTSNVAPEARTFSQLPPLINSHESWSIQQNRLKLYALSGKYRRLYQSPFLISFLPALALIPNNWIQ